MNSSANAPVGAYGVWADHSTLRRESLGPLFLRATISLRGPVDAKWRGAFTAVRHDAEQFSRFTLDVVAPSVSFTFRPAEQADLYGVLQRLELLIELSNLHATAMVAIDRRKTSA
jgi:hypothetical protein